jgi:hypothetical protein
MELHKLPGDAAGVVTAFSGATVFAAEDVPSAGGDEVSPSRDD